MMNGILNVYKERGFTSHDVVAKLRGITKQKKIGHTGTLDPDAEGVLPVCLGHATKLCDMLTDRDKAYRAVIRFGMVTDTYDTSGTILSRQESTVTPENLKEALFHFTGEQQQIPPMYSAVKVGGKKLYELARQGIEIERQPRPVIIYSITLLTCKQNESGYLTEASFDVVCSKGTYIRTLCHDIGAYLGCGACMSELLRTRPGMFSLETSMKLSQIQELSDQGMLTQYLIPVDSMFETYPDITVDTEHDRQVLAGNPIPVSWLIEEPKTPVNYKPGTVGLTNPVPDTFRARVYRMEAEDIKDFIGIYEWNPKEQTYRPIKLFLQN